MIAKVGVLAIFISDNDSVGLVNFRVYHLYDAKVYPELEIYSNPRVKTLPVRRLELKPPRNPPAAAQKSRGLAPSGFVLWDFLFFPILYLISSICC